MNIVIDTLSLSGEVVGRKLGSVRSGMLTNAVWRG